MPEDCMHLNMSPERERIVQPCCGRCGGGAQLGPPCASASQLGSARCSHAHVNASSLQKGALGQPAEHGPADHRRKH